MRVAAGGLRLAMPKQSADHRQAVTGRDEKRGEAVPQIVNAQIGEASGFADPLPAALDVAHPAELIALRKDERRWRQPDDVAGPRVLYSNQYVARLVVERHAMQAVLFDGGG